MKTRKEQEEVDITNAGKVLFPGSGIRKQDIIDYYRMAAPYMLPYLKDRPISMQRYPDGIKGENFFQKAIPEYYPSFITRAEVPEENGTKTYAAINNKKSLLYMANHAALVLHTWQSRRQRPEYPDQIIWDLDPSEPDFDKVKTGARLLKLILEDMGFTPWLKLSGSRGLHIAVAIKPELDFDRVKAFSRMLSEFLALQLPEIFTVELRKNKRNGRIFIDYLRNGYAQTACAPYGIRALEGAPVSAPILWKELEDAALQHQQYNISNMKHRLEKMGDLWNGFYESAVSIKAAEKRIIKLLEKGKK